MNESNQNFFIIMAIGLAILIAISVGSFLAKDKPTLEVLDAGNGIVCYVYDKDLMGCDPLP